MGSHWIYTGSFIGALAISLILVPLVRRIAISRTIMDAPGGHKSHTLPVPYLGGLAMVVAFSVAVIAGALVRQDLSFVDGAISFNPGGIFEPGASTLGELLLVLALALALSVMGLVDDLRGLHPYVRLAVELGVAVALIAYGIQLKSPLPDSIDTIITVIWIIGITNGFLRSNFHPAKIYMGDAGSLYLGFVLSYIGLKIKVDSREISQFFVPAVVLGIALLDTTLVVISRIKRGVSPFEGGKDHVSHRLMRLGVSVRRGVTIILLAACMLGCIGIALSKAKSDVGYWMLASLASMALVTTVLLTTKRAVLTVVTDAVDGSKSVA